jgi:hypothetical protein
MNNTIHVLPVADSKSHTEVGTRCKCEPRIEQVGDGTIVVHNAYDGREFYETERGLVLVSILSDWPLGED